MHEEAQYAGEELDSDIEELNPEQEENEADA